MQSNDLHFSALHLKEKTVGSNYQILGPKNILSSCFHLYSCLCLLLAQIKMDNCADLSGRVVIHVDMDCFYAQVEHRRLKIPSSQPLAVQQWEGLIAVNYAARAKGITRHMRVQVQCIL
jgi:hypothetical protein